MFQRFVVILTILAVIACPMFCGVGLSCCAGDHHSQTAASAAHKCSCCCHEPEQPLDEPRDLPQDSDGLCQGICGGVVMLESVKIDTRDDLLHAVPFEVVAVDEIQAENPDESLDGSSSSASSSDGSLRALLCSYLC